MASAQVEVETTPVAAAQEQQTPSLSSSDAETAETKKEEKKEEVFKLAPFNPSSDQIQEKAMELLKLEADDILFDLGCGDGRFLIAAAKQHLGLRCIGVEIDPIFANRAKDAVKSLPEDIQNRIHIREEDVLKLPMTTTTTTTTTTTSSSTNNNNNNTDNNDAIDKNDVTKLTLMDDATALYLFILPKGITKIMPLLNALIAEKAKQQQKFRVFSYMFGIHEWGEPTIKDVTAKGGCPIYLYEFNNSVIPGKK